MKIRPFSSRRISGLLFEAIVLIFILQDASWAQANSKISTDPAFTLTTTLVKQVISWENSEIGSFKFSRSSSNQFLHADLNAADGIAPFLAYTNCILFSANADLRNALYALPCINAP